MKKWDHEFYELSPHRQKLWLAYELMREDEETEAIRRLRHGSGAKPPPGPPKKKKQRKLGRRK